MISRRLFSAGVVSAALLPGGFARAQSLSDLETFIRIRCSPEGQKTTWWYSGHMLGRIEGEPAKPIFSIVGASQTSITRHDDGSVTYDLIEAGYYGEPDGDGIVDGEMINRLTGDPITPVHYLSPQSLRFWPDLTVTPAAGQLPPGIDYTGRITAPDRKQGRIWMAEELFVKVPGVNGAPDRLANSLANFEAAADDIYSDSPFTPATLQYTTWNSFRPWMNMGAASGGIMMRLNGVKLPDWSLVDDGLRARIEVDHPGIFGDA